ncbi:MAG: ATP-dependent DNA helicase RecG [Planctomycetota bacterium]|jgi:ATP-dependent DNA helicase RecG
MKEDPLATPIQYLKGVGPARAKSLEAAGIRTVVDLLYTFPRRHFDRTRIVRIEKLREGESATVIGMIGRVRERMTARRRMHILEVEIDDGTGRVPVRFFNQRFLKRSFRKDDLLLVSGVLDSEWGTHFRPTEFEVLGSGGTEPIHAAGIVPSYTVPKGVGRKAYRRMIWNALDKHIGEIPEVLPKAIRRKRRLADGRQSLRALHFPKSSKQLDAARARMAYEELFLLQVQVALKRRSVQVQAPGVRLRISNALDFRIRARIPFTLTGAQERVVGEIRRDLTSGRPMNRLLQGDVGSGKTVVAAYALLAAIGNGAQGAIIAPTEILAEQHRRTFSEMLKGSKVRIAYLGGRRAKGRKAVLESIAAGEVDLVIGTHAVVQKDVAFKRLAVAVVDEQQKFGVLQRAALTLKGDRPHVLVMTATPIPRTLTLTLFGDLDVSVLDEMPPGRRPVRTIFRASKRRPDVLEFVRNKAREGRQAFFVYPLIDESDKLAVKAAKEMHKELEAAFPKFTVGLLHGRMKSEEKDAIMADFRGRKIHILVSTIVVEVGIDVPNATVMVVDNAERYGLSQLHQLRGRIGRGKYESTCFVLSERMTERIKAFCATTDGFRIAEADLKIRGPGEMLGTAQSGLPEFRVADLVSDTMLLGWARDDARRYVASDPALAKPPGPALRRMLSYRFGGRLSLATVG